MKEHVPNILTSYRIIVIPFLVSDLVASDWGWFIFHVSLGFITDFLDGFLARRWQVKSNFGKHFDTNADKIFIVSILGMFSMLHTFPLWMFLVIATREIVVGLTRSAGVAPPVALHGKIKMWFQCGLVLLLPLEQLHLVSHQMVNVVAHITVFVTVGTGILYLIPQNKKAPR